MSKEAVHSLGSVARTCQPFAAPAIRWLHTLCWLHFARPLLVAHPLLAALCTPLSGRTPSAGCTALQPPRNVCWFCGAQACTRHGPRNPQESTTCKQGARYPGPPAGMPAPPRPLWCACSCCSVLGCWLSTQCRWVRDPGRGNTHLCARAGLCTCQRPPPHYPLNALQLCCPLEPQTWGPPVPPVQCHGSLGCADEGAHDWPRTATAPLGVG